MSDRETPSLDPLRRLVVGLMDIGSIKFGAFRLKLHDKNPNAPLSPIYVDLRLVRSAPSLLRETSALLGRQVLALNPDFVADVPTAATPIVGVIAAMFDLPMITPRPTRKEHGVAAQVEGNIRPGARVVLVDDLITRADSKLEAVALLRDRGMIVDDVVVLVDREQGGAAHLAEHGCRLHAAITLRRILEVLVEESRLPSAKRDEVILYLEQAVSP